METNNPYGYTARVVDAPELYYYRARYYDPSLQRFISQDPIGFASGDFNWYRYVGDSPVNFVDPWGLMTKRPSEDLGNAVGAEVLDAMAKKAYCDALKKDGPMGGITCENVYEKLATNPLFITPAGKNINADYMVRCRGMVTGTDWMHCKDDNNKTCN